jgi:hypothetical protein
MAAAARLRRRRAARRGVVSTDTPESVRSYIAGLIRERDEARAERDDAVDRYQALLATDKGDLQASFNRVRRERDRARAELAQATATLAELRPVRDRDTGALDAAIEAAWRAECDAYRERGWACPGYEIHRADAEAAVRAAAPLIPVTPKQRADIERDALLRAADEGRLMPPGGAHHEEFGVAANGRIMSTGWASSTATHVRDVVVWPVEGEPNDDWPSYRGPWRAWAASEEGRDGQS